MHPPLLAPIMERVEQRRGFFSLQALRKGKEGPATTNPRGNHVPQRTNRDVVSLNRPGLRGDPGCPSPLQQHGRAGVNRERLQDSSRRWLPPPPHPRVADSSFLFGLTASTWCAPATILFLPPSPQAPGSPLSPSPPAGSLPLRLLFPQPLLSVAS